MKQLADQNFDPFDQEYDIEKRFEKKEANTKKRGAKKRIFSKIEASPLKNENLSEEIAKKTYKRQKLNVDLADGSKLINLEQVEEKQTKQVSVSANH